MKDQNELLANPHAWTRGPTGLFLCHHRARRGEIVTVLFPHSCRLRAYKISADESDPIKSTGTATLSFDLNLLPRTAIVKE